MDHKSIVNACRENRSFSVEELRELDNKDFKALRTTMFLSNIRNKVLNPDIGGTQMMGAVPGQDNPEVLLAVREQFYRLMENATPQSPFMAKMEFMFHISIAPGYVKQQMTRLAGLTFMVSQNKKIMSPDDLKVMTLFTDEVNDFDSGKSGLVYRFSVGEVGYDLLKKKIVVEETETGSLGSYGFTEDQDYPEVQRGSQKFWAALRIIKKLEENVIFGLVTQEELIMPRVYVGSESRDSLVPDVTSRSLVWDAEASIKKSINLLTEQEREYLLFDIFEESIVKVGSSHFVPADYLSPESFDIKRIGYRFWESTLTDEGDPVIQVFPRQRNRQLKNDFFSLTY